MKPALFALPVFAALALHVGCGNATSSPEVSAISVTPSPCLVGRTNSQQMSATATLPNGVKEDVTQTPGINWSTGNTNTATVNPTGVVVGVNLGVTAITATFEGASGSVECTVGP
jgi:hypothetical protein